MANKEYRKESKNKKASSSKTDRQQSQKSLKEQLSPLLKKGRSQEISVIYPVKGTNNGEETSKESIGHDGGRKGREPSEEAAWEE